MAYRGLLKSKHWWLKSKPFLWIGFLCGFGLGGTVTQQVYRFNNSGYYTWSRNVNDAGYFVWRALAFPASLIRGVPNATEVTPGELSFVLLTNALLLGAVGYLIGWRIEKGRSSPATAESGFGSPVVEANLKTESFRVTVGRRALHGFVIGFTLTALLLLISFLMGFDAMWLVWWPLSLPTSGVFKLIGYVLPTYAVPTLSQVLLYGLTISLINGAFVAVLYALSNVLKSALKNRAQKP